MNDALLRIDQKKQQFDLLKPLPNTVVKNLDEWFKIELTYTSNAIEGNTLSRQETALVVEKGLTVEGKSIQEHLEAINHAKAFEFIKTLVNKKREDVSEKDILNIHGIILQKIDPVNAGRYRTVPVRIAGSTVILPNPVKVPDLMRDFIFWLHKSNDHVVKIALDTHFQFVTIHPFTDGNGRTGRLLMNLILMQAGFPPAIIKKEDRKKYLDAIEKGQLKKDLSDYYLLMYHAIEQSLDIYLTTLNPKEKPVITSQKLLKIGQLSQATKETVATIRFWTKEKLLSVAQYTKGGYQLYNLEAIEKVKQIRQLQKEKRLTIKEIREALR